MTNYFLGLLMASSLMVGQVRPVRDAAVSTAQAPPAVQATAVDDDEESASGYFSVGALTEDLRRVNVVAYVNATKIQVADSIGEPDCARNSGRGYCKYLVTAEVKEVFKGGLTNRTIEIFETADAGYPQAKFLGERVVFMFGGSEERSGSRPFFTMENSFRPIKFDVLGKLRRIVDPRAATENADPTDPYSKAALKESFAEADAIVVANATSSRLNQNNGSDTATTITATVESHVKGELRAAQSFEYEDDLLYRPYQPDDLGRQLIFLRRVNRDGHQVYERINGTVSAIKPGLLDDLRSISRQSR